MKEILDLATLLIRCVKLNKIEWIIHKNTVKRMVENLKAPESGLINNVDNEEYSLALKGRNKVCIWRRIQS